MRCEVEAVRASVKNRFSKAGCSEAPGQRADQHFLRRICTCSARKVRPCSPYELTQRIHTYPGRTRCSRIAIDACHLVSCPCFTNCRARSLHILLFGGGFLRLRKRSAFHSCSFSETGDRNPSTSAYRRRLGHCRNSLLENRESGERKGNCLHQAVIVAMNSGDSKPPEGEAQKAESELNPHSSSLSSPAVALPAKSG